MPVTDDLCEPRTSQSHWIELGDGRRLHARCWEGSGAPIVLLHGLLDSWEGWTRVCEALDRPCTAFDLPGFGASDLPTRPRISAYAEDVAAGIEALGIDGFVLVGHSLGGGVATAIAELLPDRVAALVLLAPAGFGRIRLAELTGVPVLRDGIARTLGWTLGRRLPVSVAYRAFVTNGRAPTDDVVDRVATRGADLVPGAITATRAIIASGLSEHAFHRRHVDYAGPVTAIWGTADHVVSPGHRHGVSAAFPHAEIMLWDGMGHHPQQERCPQLLDVIRGALAPTNLRRARAKRPPAARPPRGTAPARAAA